MIARMREAELARLAARRGRALLAVAHSDVGAVVLFRSADRAYAAGRVLGAFLGRRSERRAPRRLTHREAATTEEIGDVPGEEEEVVRNPGAHGDPIAGISGDRLIRHEERAHQPDPLHAN